MAILGYLSPGNNLTVSSKVCNLLILNTMLVWTGGPFLTSISNINRMVGVRRLIEQPCVLASKHANTDGLARKERTSGGHSLHAAVACSVVDDGGTRACSWRHLLAGQASLPSRVP